MSSSRFPELDSWPSVHIGFSSHLPIFAGGPSFPSEPQAKTLVLIASLFSQPTSKPSGSPAGCAFKIRKYTSYHPLCYPSVQTPSSLTEMRVPAFQVASPASISSNVSSPSSSQRSLSKTVQNTGMSSTVLRGNTCDSKRENGLRLSSNSFQASCRYSQEGNNQEGAIWTAVQTEWNFPSNHSSLFTGHIYKQKKSSWLSQHSRIFREQ